MQIATIVFSYNRAEHVRKVLDALEKNTEMPDKLYVFQDGLKSPDEKEKWEQTCRVVRNILWCDCETIISDKNKGLAQSIVSGLDFVFKEYDAVIVLEDDCVPHPLFMTYMKKALEYYEDMESIYSVGACGWPLDVEPNGTDVYFTRRISSYGWATWKKKWEIFEQDYQILGRIKKNEALLQQLHIWGEDLESHLLGNVYGTCNSWAVFWALNVLERGGYCVAPYESLIDNIGFDGTGVHSGKDKPEIGLLDINCRKDFIFNSEIAISENTEYVFSNHFAWTSSGEKNTCYYRILLKWMQLHMQGKTVNDYFKKREISKICVWGRGKVCELLLQEVDTNVDIIGIIESKPTVDEWNGISIINPKHIPWETQLIVVLPEYDKDRIIETVKKIGKTINIIGFSDLLEKCI